MSPQAVRRAGVGVEAPAHPRPAHPVTHALERVVVEVEQPAHRRQRDEVEDLGGGEPGVGELEQAGRDAEHRVGLAQRPVGEPERQPVPRMRRVRRLRGPASPGSSGSAGSPSTPKLALMSGA